MAAGNGCYGAIEPPGKEASGPFQPQTSPLPSPSPTSASVAPQLLPTSAPLCLLLSEGPHCSALPLADTG